MNKRTYRSNTAPGFTLMELLLVITIISILSAVVVPKLMGHSQQARIAAAKQTIVGTLSGGLGMFEQAVGRYPTTDEGLEVLILDRSIPNWDGPYIQSAFIPLDPWKTPFRYTFPSELTSSTILYDIVSAGPDGTFGNEDDISNHNFSDAQTRQ